MQISLDTLRNRHSIRTFSGPCSAEQVRRLNAVITDINTHGVGMHFQLVTADSAVFSSFTKAYGMFKGVSDYVACVADTSYANYLERAGFYGMQVVLSAVSMGLGTCFVSGTYDKDKVKARVRVGQELIMLIALGQKPSGTSGNFVAKLAHAIMHRGKKLKPEDFLETDLPKETLFSAIPKLATAMEAVCISPSAYNKKPVRVCVAKTSESYNIQAKVPTKNKQQQIDLGIAMYAFQIPFPGVWDWGNPATFFPDE